MTHEPASLPGTVTQWLLAWGRSDKQGLNHLLPAVDEQLHRLGAVLLQISGATVEREWVFARAGRFETIEGAGPG